MLWTLFRLQSGWSGQELGSPFLLCDMWQASRGMGKRFTLLAYRHSCGLERTHGPCLRLLLLPGQYHWCKSKVQTHCSISKFTVCVKASTCAKADAEWQWIKDEDVGQANIDMDGDPTLAGARSSNEKHLLTLGNLNDIVRDLKLSKNQAEILGS